MKIVLILSSFGVLSGSSAAAFIFGEPMGRNPKLTEYMEGLALEQKVNLHLDIGPRKETSTQHDAALPHMPIQNFGLSLQKFKEESKKFKMPGAHGKYPKLSAGVNQMIIDKAGQFITTAGAQEVQVHQSGWELVWKKDAQAGSLILGFDVAQDYERNGVHFPSGPVYMNFAVWSKEGLEQAREIKHRTIQRAKDALKERDEEIVKMESASNILMKAWHYRNIYAAIETYTLQPIQHFNDWVPEDDQVLKLSDELFVNKKGFCWTMDLPWGREEVIGTAKLCIE